jgi:hypothetical protein
MIRVNDTLDARAQTYGDFGVNARFMQELKTNMRRCPRWGALAPAQAEALDQIASKMARILFGDPAFTDSWHDIGGYAMLGERACAPAPAEPARTAEPAEGIEVLGPDMIGDYRAGFSLHGERHHVYGPTADVALGKARVLLGILPEYTEHGRGITWHLDKEGALCYRQA